MTRHLIFALCIALLSGCGSESGPRLIEGPLVTARLVCAPSAGPAEKALFLKGTLYGQNVRLGGSLSEERVISASQVDFSATGIALSPTVTIENNSAAKVAVIADGNGTLTATVNIFDPATSTTEATSFSCTRSLLYAGLDFVRIGVPDGNGELSTEEQNTVANQSVPYAIGGFVRGANGEPRSTPLPAGCQYRLAIEDRGQCRVTGQNSQSVLLDNNQLTTAFQCAQPGSYSLLITDIEVDQNANPDATLASCTPQVRGANGNFAVSPAILNISEDNIETIRRMPPVCTLKLAGEAPREGSIAANDICPQGRSGNEPPIFLGDDQSFTAVVRNPNTGTHYYVAGLIDENEQVRPWGFALFDGTDESIANNITDSSNCQPFSVSYDANGNRQALQAPNFDGNLDRCSGQYVQAFLATPTNAPLVPASAPSAILQPQIEDVQLLVADDPVTAGALTPVDAQCRFVGSNNFVPCANNASAIIVDWSSSSCTNGTFTQLPVELSSNFIAELDGATSSQCTLTAVISDADGRTGADAAIVNGSQTFNTTFQINATAITSFKIEPALSCVGRTKLLSGLAAGSRVRGHSALTITDVQSQIPGCTGSACTTGGATLSADQLVWLDSDNIEPGYWNGTACESTVDDTGVIGQISDLVSGSVAAGIEIVDCPESEDADQCYGASSLLRLQSYCVTATIPGNPASGQPEVSAGSTIMVFPLLDDRLLNTSIELCDLLEPILTVDLLTGDQGLGPQLVNTFGNVIDPILATLDTVGGIVPGGASGELIELLLYGTEDSTFPFGLATLTSAILGSGSGPIPVGLNLLGFVELLSACTLSPVLDILKLPFDFLFGGGFGQVDLPSLEGCRTSGENLVEAFQDAFNS